MEQNKIGKYLKYALGEILLVMIGILLALQVNNWNEQKKIVKQEKATIANLHLEFKKNLITLNGDMKVLQQIIDASNSLLVNIGPDYQFGTLKNVDSLISMTPRMVVWDPSQYTLSDIKASGKLSSLSNENLKIKLIEWESFYNNLLDWGDFYTKRGESYFEFLTNNSLNRNINMMVNFKYGKSKFKGSNEQLLRSQLFENMLVDRVTTHIFMLEFYEDAREQIIGIIDECKSYQD